MEAEMEAITQKALQQYLNQLKHSANYYNRKKQEKIENGTYRGRGRPRKVKEEGSSSPPV